MSIPKSERHVSTSRVIAAPAQEIFDVLADPAKHSIIDGSGSLVGAKGNPPRLFLGAKFGMKMSSHATMRNKVVEFDDVRFLSRLQVGSRNHQSLHLRQVTRFGCNAQGSQSYCVHCCPLGSSS